MELRLDNVDLELIEELAYAFLIVHENEGDPFELNDGKVCGDTIRKFVDFVKEKESES